MIYPSTGVKMVSFCENGLAFWNSLHKNWLVRLQPCLNRHLDRWQFFFTIFLIRNFSW
jgi:hypothetical protein